MTLRNSQNDLPDIAAAGVVPRVADPRFADACTGFQTANRHRPSVVVQAGCTGDIQAAVRYAADRGLSVAVRSSGHGLVTATEGGVLVDTRALAEVRVDPASRSARVSAGTPWAQVVTEAARYRLAPLSGSSPEVGAIGYTLGGGLGVLAREYGYAADHVRRVELVTADGSVRQLRADQLDGSQAELFWAVRGAGANFGIATSMEIDLLPVTRLYGGGLYFDTDLVPDALAAYREWTADLPDQLTSSVGLIPYPDLPMLPEPLRGRYVAHVRIAYRGSFDAGERLVAPLRAVGPRLLDTLGELSYPETPSIYNDPPVPHGYYGTNAMLGSLPTDWATTVLDLVGPDSPVPCVVQLNHLGGALARPPAVPNAVAHRQAAYLLRVLAVVDGPGPSPAHAAPERLAAAVQPWTLGRSPNFVFGVRDDPQRARDCYSAEDYRRLARLKAKIDPTNVFRCNLNIPPAG